MKAVDPQNNDSNGHQQKPDKDEDAADVMHTANPANRLPAKPPLPEVILKAGKAW